MTEAIDRASDYFGMPELSFHLDRRSRDRLFTVSFFPFMAVAMVFIDLYIDVFQGDSVTGPSEAWRTVSRVAETINGVALVTSGAILFFAALSRWTRDEASWMLATGVAMTALAIVLGAISAVILATTEGDFVSDWRPYFWLRFATVFGALAVGYFFVAFRGLVIDPLFDLRASHPAGDEYINEPGEPDKISD